jgi:hypothetical protein
MTLKHWLYSFPIHGGASELTRTDNQGMVVVGLARTIADLPGYEDIQSAHLAEPLSAGINSIHQSSHHGT